MDQRRLFRIMEIVWLCIAIVSCMSAAWSMSKGDFDSGKYSLFVTFCASILFALRRYQRKRLENSSDNSNTSKK